MYLTHGSRASVEGFGDRDGRRGARGTEDHREVRGIGDSSESLVGSDPGDIAGKQQPRTCRADAAPHDGRRPGRGQEGAGCQRRFPVITARSMECSSEPGVIAAGAGALPRARRRCEAGKRTHGPGPRACLALLAATALLALAAPAQAQTEVWSERHPHPGRHAAPRLQQSALADAAAPLLSEDSFTYDRGRALPPPRRTVPIPGRRQSRAPPPSRLVVGSTPSGLADHQRHAGMGSP